MSRLTIVNPDTATDAQKDLFAAVKGVFGGVPNLFRVVGNSPAALEGMLGLFGGLGKTAISGQLREQIAMAVAQRNECNYCLAAHTAISKGAGIAADIVASARKGEAPVARDQAALTFAVSLVEKRGKVSAAEVTAVKAAGFSDAEVVEIVATVVFNIFTNYINIAGDVDIDFPAA
jgi:uncharacterized peroxidase-related enzyme